MTALRRRILELLCASGRPTGAYELIEAVTRRDSRPVGPPTVYRALEFLMAQGLVSTIDSLNAYVPCVHPERDHDCLFFICSRCRASVELEDPRIGGLLAEDAAVFGFVATRRTVEVEGMCAQCAEVGAAQAETRKTVSTDADRYGSRTTSRRAGWPFPQAWRALADAIDGQPHPELVERSN